MKKLLSLLCMAMLALTAIAQNFEIDLTANPVATLPDGVTQVSYPQNGVSYNGAQHGWCWYAFKFNAAGPVKITLGGCQHINTGYEGYVEAAGVKIADFTNKTTGCYNPANPTENIATYVYTGAPQELTVYCGQYCPYVKVEEYVVPSVIEAVLIKTSFADWTEQAVADKEATMTVSTKTVTTKKTKENITFTLTGCSVYPNGGGKVSAMADGYICAMKQQGDNLATIETTEFAHISTVSYFHRATGNNRGWGLKVKGDGDTDWVVVQDALTNSTGTQIDDIQVNRTHVKLMWYNLSQGNYAALSNLVIKGNYEAPARSFNDFEINLQGETVTEPAGVTRASYPQNGAAFHDASHGWSWYACSFAVDGPVEITLGGCAYTNFAYVCNAAGDTLGTIDTNSPGCWHSAPATNVAKWVYNVEAPETLTVYCGQYCPYIKVAACDFVESVYVDYYDQDDRKVGQTVEVLPTEPMMFAYGEADITVPAGQAFRGWFYANGKKFYEGSLPGEDLKLYAKVTPIETAEVGSIFRYALSDQFFYVEDHECILTEGTGKYHDNQHGWSFASGDKILLPVAGKAYVQLGLCQYSSDGDIQVTVKSTGNAITAFSGHPASCQSHTFFYDGAADTLVITFPATNYISMVNVFNVEAALTKSASGYYEIAKNDAASFILALLQAEKGDKIFLPNGVYDLGEAVLTSVNADSVSIIGQSTEGTIIKNYVPIQKECIDKTATILNSANHTYMQDLTLQNTLEYYKASTGRAVALMDAGSFTVCKNVRLLSYQDTYYSRAVGMKAYFEGGAIHGTVDYICGSGSIYFKNLELYCEKRKADGSGEDCITASNAQKAHGDMGYLFEGCTIKSECPTVSLSRAWNDEPQVVYLNTTVDYSAGNFGFNLDGKIQRWTIEGMNNVDPYLFAEYNTMDVDGNVISPASNVVTFKSKNNPVMETILTSDSAAVFTMDYFFNNEWNPAAVAAQEDLSATKAADGALTWAATTATVFLKETETGAEIVTSLPDTFAEGVTYRAANGRGGFGPAAVINVVDDIDNVEVSLVRKFFIDGQLIIEKDGIQYNALGQVIR